MYTLDEVLKYSVDVETIKSLLDEISVFLIQCENMEGFTQERVEYKRNYSLDSGIDLVVSHKRRSLIKIQCFFQDTIESTGMNIIQGKIRKNRGTGFTEMDVKYIQLHTGIYNLIKNQQGLLIAKAELNGCKVGCSISKNYDYNAEVLQRINVALNWNEGNKRYTMTQSWQFTASSKDDECFDKEVIDLLCTEFKDEDRIERSREELDKLIKRAYKNSFLVENAELVEADEEKGDEVDNLFKSLQI